jgi:hypothetical protein
VDEQEHPANPEPPASGETAPVTGPPAGAGPDAGAGTTAGSGPVAATGTAAVPVAPGAAGSGAAEPGRERRGDGVRDVLTSRATGWAVAAAMAGAVVGLSVAMATSSSPTVVVQPDSAAGLRGTAARAARAAVPGGVLQAVAPGGRVPARAPARLRVQVPAAATRQAPARLRIQIPAGGALRAPAKLRIQVPAAATRRAPALRLLAPVPGPAGTLIRLPRAAQVLPGRQVIASVAAPRAVRVRVRPGQVRVRLRLPANGRVQVFPRGQIPGPLRVVTPGSRPALVPAAPARLRIVFRNGTPVPARLVIPANLPGQARLRIQVPARARITKAVPAPPNW